MRKTISLEELVYKINNKSNNIFVVFKDCNGSRLMLHLIQNPLSRDKPFFCFKRMYKPFGIYTDRTSIDGLYDFLHTFMHRTDGTLIAYNTLWNLVHGCNAIEIVPDKHIITIDGIDTEISEESYIALKEQLK